MRDLHVHTEFSCDSEAKIEDYALKGIAGGVKQICFTEHVDSNINDYGYNYYEEKRFFQAFNIVKEKYREEIELLSGIEFGEPHLYYERLKELSKQPYDFVIGSIHWIGNMFPCQEVRDRYSSKEFFKLYWQEVLKTAKIGGFDALGHIDFPKRYYGEIYYEEEVISEIFKNIIDKDMVIEINTSSLRKGCDEMMPGKEILEIYKDNGGQFVTIGSDSHVVSDLAADYIKAKECITEIGLQEVFYVGRKRKL